MKEPKVLIRGYSNKMFSFFRVLMLWSITLCTIYPKVAARNGADTFRLNGEGWSAQINSQTGCLQQYVGTAAGGNFVVPFRSDGKSGLTFEGVVMQPSKTDQSVYSAVKDQIKYQICYKSGGDHLRVECSISNCGKESFSPHRIRLHLGVDAEMHGYPEWNDKFFPTLVRCEKDYAWGYFMSPEQHIFAFSTENPVASYGLNYIYEGVKEWRWGHQILSASLDLLHKGPLPERHPVDCGNIAPGQTREWVLHLGHIEALDLVKSKLATWAHVPMIEMSRYTLFCGEETTMKIYCPDKLAMSQLLSPNGDMLTLAAKECVPNRYIVQFPRVSQTGTYKCIVRSKSGKQAEAMVYVREPWSWYLDRARNFVAAHPPFMSEACETYYGYYTAFLGAYYLPDKTRDFGVIKRFERSVSKIIDSKTGLPQPNALPKRVQNFSSLIGILEDLWRLTGDDNQLELAAKIADYLCSDSMQWRDGSYRCGSTHYTAVIYPAKSMFELAAAERLLSHKDPLWQQRYERHLYSAVCAVENLILLRDNIQTEGDMTFEDGMITCSALQVALYGLSTQNVQTRQRCIDVARYLMDKHRCLEQLLIPDCRMRGATLRYWEALDIYFSPNQVMNSPHGWSAWKIYAVCYLYLLTGETHYLRDMMETMGSCVQLMDHSGNLRWGFLPDPYVDGVKCVAKADNPRGWLAKEQVVGEQYMEMISPWLRPDDEESMCVFGKRGGAGDNTVHEIFKAMTECALTVAYVVVDATGNVQGWNCRVQKTHGIYEVIPYEKTVCRIHVNTAFKLKIKAVLQHKDIELECPKGMSWIGSPLIEKIIEK